MIDEKIKEEIDNMSQLELCRIWRFAESDSPYLQGDTGEYFVNKFYEKGGFTPEISKQLGWSN